MLEPKFAGDYLYPLLGKTLAEAYGVEPIGGLISG